MDTSVNSRCRADSGYRAAANDWLLATQSRQPVSGNMPEQFCGWPQQMATRIPLELVANLQATCHTFLLPKVALQANANQQCLVLECACVQTHLDQAAGPLHAG